MILLKVILIELSVFGSPANLVINNEQQIGLADLAIKG
jgi:hypothetical protein